MKIAPPSGDMLIKLALAALGVGVAVYVVRKIGKLGSGAYEAVEAATDATLAATKYINPTSPDNVAYQTVNTVYGGIAGTIFRSPEAPGKNADGSWTYGAFLYDLTNKDAFTGKWWWQK